MRIFRSLGSLLKSIVHRLRSASRFVHPEDEGGWTDWDIVQMIASVLGVELGVDGACQLVKKEEVKRPEQGTRRF